MTALLITLVWLVALALSVFVGRWATARLLAHIDAADRKARDLADDGGPGSAAGRSVRSGGAGEYDDDGGFERPADAAGDRVDDGFDRPAGEAGDRVDDGVDGARVRAVLRGGMWIGVLERLAVTSCILVGFTPGIAVVVAVKGLGRFPQLRDDPTASERFVIGSLASLLWAAALGFAGLCLIALLDPAG